jgi:hypothetical protein
MSTEPRFLVDSSIYIVWIDTSKGRNFAGKFLGSIHVCITTSGFLYSLYSDYVLQGINVVSTNRYKYN